MNSKQKWLTSFVSALVIGGGAHGGAQTVKALGQPQQYNPMRTHRGTRSGPSDPIGSVLGFAPIIPVQASAVAASEDDFGPQPRFTGAIYDNRQNAVGYRFYYNSDTFFKNVVDDFDLPVGVTEVTTTSGTTTTTTTVPATVSSLVFSVVVRPTATTSQAGTTDLYGAITFYDKVDLVTVPNNNAAQNPIGTYTFTLTALAASATPANSLRYDVTLTFPAGTLPVLPHDFGNDTANYGIQFALFSDAARTVPHKFISNVLNAFGVAAGFSDDVYFNDDNLDGMFSLNTLSATPPPKSEAYFIGGGLHNQANLFFQLNGTTASPLTYTVQGAIELAGFSDISIPASGTAVNPVTLPVTFILRDTTGVMPDRTITGNLPLDDSTDIDPMTGNFIPEVSYQFFGTPAGTYLVNIKVGNYLAQNVPLTITSNLFSDTGLNAVLTLSGDATLTDNVVDIADFGSLVNAYGTTYDPTDVTGVNPNVIASDFNGDGTVDIGDFGILVNNYGTSGATLP